MHPPDASHVLVVMNRWDSSAGGIQTVNRKLAIAFTKVNPLLRCTALVASATPQDKTHAELHGVTLIQGGPDEDDWSGTLLSPEFQRLNDQPIHAIIGHSSFSGRIASQLRERLAPGAKLVQCIHMSPLHTEALKEYRRESYVTERESRHTVEMQFALAADLVACIGPRLARFTRDHLRAVNSTVPVVQVDCGMDHSSHVYSPPEHPTILCTGRTESMAVKGLDIFAKAAGILTRRWVTNPATSGLPRPLFQVRGARDAKEALEQRLQDLSATIGDRASIRVLSYTTDTQQLLSDYRGASVFSMPSREEGFGLVACEALSEGVPIIVSSESGLGETLHQLARKEALRVEGCRIDHAASDDVIAEKYADAMLAYLLRPADAVHYASLIRQHLLATNAWQVGARQLLDALGLGHEKTTRIEDHSRPVHSTQSSTPQLIRTAKAVPNDQVLRSITLGKWVSRSVVFAASFGLMWLVFLSCSFLAQAFVLATPIATLEHVYLIAIGSLAISIYMLWISRSPRSFVSRLWPTIIVAIAHCGLGLVRTCMALYHRRTVLFAVIAPLLATLALPAAQLIHESAALPSAHAFFQDVCSVSCLEPLARLAPSTVSSLTSRTPNGTERTFPQTIKILALLNEFTGSAPEGERLARLHRDLQSLPTVDNGESLEHSLRILLLLRCDVILATRDKTKSPDLAALAGAMATCKAIATQLRSQIVPSTLRPAQAIMLETAVNTQATCMEWFAKDYVHYVGPVARSAGETPGLSLSDVCDRAESLRLESVSLVANTGPTRQARALNNLIDFMQWRLRLRASQDRDHFRVKDKRISTAGPTSIDGQTLANGEPELDRLSGQLRVLAKAHPRAEFFVTLTQVDLLLAHSQVEQLVGHRGTEEATSARSLLSNRLNTAIADLSTARALGRELSDLVQDAQHLNELGFRSWLFPPPIDDSEKPPDIQSELAKARTALRTLCGLPASPESLK